MRSSDEAGACRGLESWLNPRLWICSITGVCSRCVWGVCKQGYWGHACLAVLKSLHHVPQHLHDTKTSAAGGLLACLPLLR
jgi:hypothetical protein